MAWGDVSEAKAGQQPFQPVLDPTPTPQGSPELRYAARAAAPLTPEDGAGSANIVRRDGAAHLKSTPMASGGGFQVEYARSGRASCRNTKCKGNIVSEPPPRAPASCSI